MAGCAPSLGGPSHIPELHAHEDEGEGEAEDQAQPEGPVGRDQGAEVVAEEMVAVVPAVLAVLASRSTTSRRLRSLRQTRFATGVRLRSLCSGLFCS